ncbi:MAG: hypothetical protein RR232_05135 [Clostridia bacterium]
MKPRFFAVLIAAMLLASLIPSPSGSLAVDDTLLPEDIQYDSATLGKSAARTGTDTWRITLSVTPETAPLEFAAISDAAADNFFVASTPEVAFSGIDVDYSLSYSKDEIRFLPSAPIPCGTTLLITYALRLIPDSLIPGVYNRIPLGKNAALSFAPGSGKTALLFPAPMCRFEAGRLDLLYELCNGGRVLTSGRIGDVRDTFITDAADKQFRWQAPSSYTYGGTTYLLRAENTRYESSNAPTALVLTGESAQSLSALSGSHTITYVYMPATYGIAPGIPDTGDVSLILLIIATALMLTTGLLMLAVTMWSRRKR